MLGRLLSRKGSRKGESEEEAKAYKKAHLGESLGQLYFNDELKMWVERGKEDEARAEKAKLSAPPPSVGTMSAASSSTSLNTAGIDAAGLPPVPGGNAWTRGRSLKDRYIATPGAGPPPPSGSNSNPPSGKSALLPGSGPASGSGLVPGIPKVPGLPAGPSRPGSFFMPTPAASDTASDAAAGGNGGDNSSTAGGMSQSQSGVSMDAFVPGGPATGKAPAFFMPAVPASTGSGGAAEPSAADGQCESDSAAAAAHDKAAAAAREGRDSSAGGSLGELSRPGNLSFATWTPQPADSVHDSKSPTRSSAGGQQQNAAGHLLYAGAGSNGNHMSYAPYSNGGAYGNPVAAGVDPEGAATASTAATHHAEGTAAPNQYGSSDWSSHAAAGAPSAAGEKGGEAGGFDSWQQQQPQDPFGGQPQDPFGEQPQDPFGQPQNPFGAPVAAAQETAAEGAWAGADAEGGTDYSAAAGPAAAEGYSADAYAYNQYNGWEQQGYGYGYDANAYQQGYQQGAAEGGEAAQQQQQQHYGNANGYSHGMYGSSGYYAAGETTADQQQQQQGVSDLGAGDSAAGEADGVAAAEASKGYDQHAYYQQQHLGQQQQQMGEQHHHQQQQRQQMPALLDPVHPELPGISTVLTREGSDELGPLMGSTSATAARRATSASAASASAARHQSAPGSAPHPARFGSGIPSPGGAAGGYMSVPPARSNSLHTPGAAGVSSLLPPHRASFNGSGSPPLRAESSTLTVPTPAVVGDTSMLTMVRPSSPYARSVSPLTQQRSPRGLSRGDSSSPLARGDSGFPIPSPPTQMLGKPGVFVPGSIGGAAAAVAMAPWQPSAAGSAVDAAKQHSSAGVHAAAQGSGFGAPMVLDGYMGTTGSHPGAGINMARHAAAAGAGSAGGSAPMHVAAANGNGPLPWASSQQYDADAAANKGTDRLFGPGSMPGIASSAPWQQQHHGQHGQEQRTHPYDAFVNTELVHVNWRAHHYKQPGKLNRQTPYEEFEMQRAREEEAQEQLTPTKKREAFWYRQMEHRRKLPAGFMKPSASEPAHMPSHAAAGRAAAPPSPGDSSLSQASNYTDWQQHHNQQQQQQQAAAPPCTPACAVTADAAYAVAGRSPGEEPTPTSKFMPLPATAEDDSDVPAAASADALGSSGDASASHQQQVSMPAAAAHGSSQEAADGSSWQAEQQQHAQYYAAPSYGAEGQPDVNAAYQYPPEYYAQWQEYYAQQGYPHQGYQQGYEQQQEFGQQQQQPEPDQQVQQQPEQHQQHEALDQQQQQQQHLQGYGSELEQLPADGNAVQRSAAASAAGVVAGGSAAAAAASPAVGLWGDGAEQQQLDAATAAAADEAASAWDADAGAFDVLDLPAEQLPLDAADSNAAAQADAHAHEFHGQYQQLQQRSARVSMSSSTGGSQPSTAKAAAAASRHIVSSAVSRIIQEHEDEAAGAAAAGLADAADPAAAGVAFIADTAAIGVDAAAVADGWQGDAGDGWEADEHAAAAAADGTELVPGYEAYPARASAAAAGEQEQQAGEVAADAAAMEGSAEAAAAAPVYPQCWQRMRQLMASTPMGDDFAAYRDPFVTYGDWLFWQLPELAAADEGTAAGDNSSGMQQQQQQAEHLELLEMYGEAQMKADVMADAFKAGGLNLDAVFEQLALCDGEAADVLLL